MGNFTFADLIFEIKDKIVDFFDFIKEKIVDFIKFIAGKVDNFYDKVFKGVKNAKSTVNKKSKEVKEVTSDVTNQSGSLFDRITTLKNKIIHKLGFDKYKKEYTKYQIGEDNFVKNDEIENEKYKLFVDIVEALKLNTKDDPNQIEVLANYVSGRIEPEYIKNTYNMAMLADDVVKSKSDTDIQLENGLIINIEYNGKNNVRMYINGLQETNCIKIGRTLKPEERMSGLDDLIARSSVRLPGEPEPKSPMEILMALMGGANPGGNAGNN